jgi:hypothetical protein
MTWEPGSDATRPCGSMSVHDERLPIWPVATGLCLAAAPVALIVLAAGTRMPGLALAPTVLAIVTLCALLPITLGGSVLYLAIMLGVAYLRSKERRMRAATRNSILK